MTRRTLALALLLVGSSIATPRSAVVIPSARPSGGDAATAAVAPSATPGGTGQRPAGAPLAAEEVEGPGSLHPSGESGLRLWLKARSGENLASVGGGGAPQLRTTAQPSAQPVSQLGGGISTAIQAGWISSTAL